MVKKLAYHIVKPHPLLDKYTCCGVQKYYTADLYRISRYAYPSIYAVNNLAEDDLIILTLSGYIVETISDRQLALDIRIALGFYTETN